MQSEQKRAAERKSKLEEDAKAKEIGRKVREIEWKAREMQRKAKANMEEELVAKEMEGGGEKMELDMIAGGSSDDMVDTAMGVSGKKKGNEEQEGGVECGEMGYWKLALRPH